MNASSADLPYIFYEAKAELSPAGENKETVPKFCLVFTEPVGRSRMAFCRSGAGYISGSSSVSYEERKGRDQVEIHRWKNVLPPLHDKEHPMGIL